MMKKMKKSAVGTAMALAMMTTLLGNGASSYAAVRHAAPREKIIKVAMIPKAMGVPYFTAAYDGAKSVASKLGIQLTYSGPTTNPTAALQTSLINSFVAQGYNVIVISSIDPAGVAPALRNAMRHGVKVEAWDADTIPSARNLFVAATTNQYLVTAPLQTIENKVHGKQTDVAVFSDTPTDQQHNIWLAEMRRLIATKYRNLHIVTVAYGQSEPGPSLTAAENILKGYPNVKAIISIDAAAFPAAAKAVDLLGKKGKIILTGFADPASMKPYILNGTAANVILFNPTKFGKMSMYVARALANGQIPKNGNGRVVLPGFGIFQEKNYIMHMGKAFVWNKSNIDTANF